MRHTDKQMDTTASKPAMITLRLPKELREAVNELAWRSKTSVNAMIVDMLKEAVGFENAKEAIAPTANHGAGDATNGGGLQEARAERIGNDRKARGVPTSI